jgi:hypothetical protein
MGAGERRREEGAVEPDHRIEDFMRRYRVLVVAVLIGAILVVGWLLVGPLLTIPRVTSAGPVVRNGVAAIVACGKKQGIRAGMMAAGRYADEPGTGTWWHERRGECTVWYHRPPDWHQRLARQERAH